MRKTIKRQLRLWLNRVWVLIFMTGASMASADGASVNRPCEPIHLAPEVRSKTVKGMLLPETQHCYALNLPKGQNAKLRLITDSDIVFDVVDHAQAETDYLATGQAEPYEIRIFQRYRSITPEYYRLSVKTASEF